MAKRKVGEQMPAAIAAKLKDTPEQTTVVGPLVEFLAP